MKTIIVAVDFSNATQGVLDTAVSQARAFGAGLRLFHAVEPEPSYTAYGFTPEEFPAMHVYQIEARRRAVIKLDELAAQARAEVADVTAHVAEGAPLYALLDYATEAKADLVVLGSHGHGVIASLLLGGVAEGMVRKATTPTLVVPAAPE